jgi:PKD repeat protein
MKKLLLLPILFLIGLISLSAQPITTTVSGHVSSSTDGSDVPFWPILINNSPDSSGNVLFALTDDNGNYNLEVTVQSGVSSLLVQTFDGCFGLEILKNAPIINGSAVADFVICKDSIPPPQDDCSAQIFYTPMGSNEFSFQALTNSLDSNLLFSWDFGDGTVGTGSPIVHQYAQTGVYNVTLISSSASCVISTMATVFVSGGNTGALDSILVSGYVTNNSDNSAVEGWGIFSGFDSVFIFNYGVTNSNGFYSFYAVVPEGSTSVQVMTQDFCTGLLVIVDAPIVNGTAEANFQICYDAPPPLGCYAYIQYEQQNGLTYDFNADFWSNDSLGGVSYVWDFGDGSTSTLANPSYTYAEDGVYTVILTVTNGNGCIAHACEVVCTFGGNYPIDTFYYGCQAMFYLDYFNLNNPSGGFDNTFNFIDVSFGAVQSWAWDFGDGATSNEQNPTHTYTEDGTFMVSLHITTLDGCESDMFMEVYVGNNPWNEWNCQAMFLPLPADSSGLFYFIDISSAPTPIQSWTWDFGDGTSSTEQNPFHAYAQPGLYTVSLTIAADSCNSIFSIDFDTENPGFNNVSTPVLGLSSLVSKTDDKQEIFETIQLSPNPTVADLNIVFESKKAQDYEINIVDLSGKIVSKTQQKANIGANVAHLNVADLTPSLYMVQLKAADRIQTLKFVKQ